MREAGLDPTDVAALTKDRKEWRIKVGERSKHVKMWEMSKGKLWDGPEVQRNEVGASVRVFDCRICGRVCKSKSGLVNHRRRTHEQSSARRIFECEKCKRTFGKESERVNHAKICGGAEASAEGRVKCVCGKELSKGYFRKHRRICAAWTAQQGAAAEEVVPAAARGPCPDCGRIMRRDNIARHSRTACPGSVAGP